MSDTERLDHVRGALKGMRDAFKEKADSTWFFGRAGWAALAQMCDRLLDEIKP